MKYFSKNIFSGQNGFMLLEALISMLIFAVGILGIVNLQAFSITNTTNIRYRITASLLADQLIGQMWGSDRSNLLGCENTQIVSDWKLLVIKTLPTSIPIATCSVDTIDIDIYWILPESGNLQTPTHKYHVSNKITPVNKKP